MIIEEANTYSEQLSFILFLTIVRKSQVSLPTQVHGQENNNN